MTKTTTTLRLLLPAALLGAAIMLGGLAAVLATFVAALLVLDQALDRAIEGAGPAAAFDAQFRPPAFSRGRWIALCVAAQRGAAFPPIAVFRVGDRHYVRDGHHRVSVARALGQLEIDADVVELSGGATPTAA